MKQILLGVIFLFWSCSGQNADKYYNNGCAKGEAGNYKEAIND